MNILLIILGYVYIFVGLIFLFIPLVYLELGRPKDLFIGALNLFIGITFILKNKVFTSDLIGIFFLISLIVIINLQEICLSRWNLLTDKEKNDFLTFPELKKNILKIKEAIGLGMSKFNDSSKIFEFKQDNKNLDKKKWVRNDKNDKIKS